MKAIVRAFLVVLLVFALLPTAHAASTIVRELPAGLQIPDAAKPGPNFDVDRATQAYLDLLTPEQRALSNDYFEGGYWIQLWEFVYGIGIAAVLLYTGLSRRMRDIGRRVSRPWVQTLIYGFLWVLAAFLLGLPADIYTGFVREHQYGLATQDFAGWFGDALKGLMVSLVIVPPVIALIYAAVRKAGDRWWVWASGGAFVLILFVLMLAPVFVEPLFNDYKPLREGAVRQAVLSLARANQIPTNNVVEFDASRQTTRISANVAGFLGTTRVAQRQSPQQELVARDQGGDGSRNGPLRTESRPEIDGLPDARNRVCALGRASDDGLGVGALGCALWTGRTHRSGGVTARSRDLLAVFPAGDTAQQLDCASGRSRGRCVRPQRRARATRFRDGGDAPQHLSKTGAKSARGNHLLRSSKRIRSRARLDDLAQGTSAERAGKCAGSRAEAGAAGRGDARAIEECVASQSFHPDRFIERSSTEYGGESDEHRQTFGR